MDSMEEVMVLSEIIAEYLQQVEPLPFSPPDDTIKIFPQKNQRGVLMHFFVEVFVIGLSVLKTVGSPVMEGNQ